MYRRILVATDGSATSNRAVREALRLAKEGKSALRIVHVVDLVTLAVETPQAWSEYEAAVRESGAQILKRAAAIARKAGVKPETALLEVKQYRNRIGDEICRDAESWRAELIAIGTHGRRGVTRLFLGSVAESVIRIAAAPVLLIRGK